MKVSASQLVHGKKSIVSFKACEDAMLAKMRSLRRCEACDTAKLASQKANPGELTIFDLFSPFELQLRIINS